MNGKRISRTVWAALVMSTIAAAAGWAVGAGAVVDQSDQAGLQQASLRGIDAVYVEVAADGVSAPEIKAFAEKWLRHNGVPLLDEPTPSSAVARVEVCAGERSSVCAMSVRLDLFQDVRLARQPDLGLRSSTWSRSRTNAVSKRSLNSSIQVALSTMIYDFAFAWAAENPGAE